MFSRLRQPVVRALATMLVFSLLAACTGATDTADPAPSELALSAGDTSSTSSAVAVESSVPTTNPSTTTTSTTTTTTTTTIPPDPHRTWIATATPAVAQLFAYTEPGGALVSLPFLVPNPHQFGTPLTLMITEGRPGDEWVRVQLPIRPNGQEAWIHTEGWEIGQTRVSAEVDLTTRRVRVWDGEELIAETPAVVGADRTPTPVGTFAVSARVDDYFGAPALALTAFSEALDTFSGGLPVIAIHVTLRSGQEQDPSVRSNGCVRIPEEAVRFLAEHVPLGAPVTIVA